MGWMFPHSPAGWVLKGCTWLQSHIPVPTRDPVNSGTETRWNKGAIPDICASPQLGVSQAHWDQCSAQCMEELLRLSRPLQVLSTSGSCLKLFMPGRGQGRFPTVPFSMVSPSRGEGQGGRRESHKECFS